MSGEFTRHRYDLYENETAVRDSTKPGLLTLSTIQQLDDACYAPNGPRSTRLFNSNYNAVNYSNAIDMESNLLGIGFPLSRISENNSLIEKDAKLNEIYNKSAKKTSVQCNDYLDYKYSRLEPQSKVVELSFNRFEYPIINPLEFVYNGFSDNNTIGNNRDGSSTRYNTKIVIEEQNKKMREMYNSYQNKIVAVNG